MELEAQVWTTNMSLEVVVAGDGEVATIQDQEAKLISTNPLERADHPTFLATLAARLTHK